MTKIFDGKLVADEMLRKLQRAAALYARPLQLAAILASDNPGLEKFVRLKQKAAEKAGIDFALYKFHPSVTTRELIDVIDYLNRDSDINGILVELPLPEHVETQSVLDAVEFQKDVDVLSSKRQEKYYAGSFEILPPAVAALKNLAESERLDFYNKKIAVFGQGILVGKPITHWLKQQKAEVFPIDEFTKNPGQFSKQTDVIVTAVGKPELISDDLIKKDAIIIDFGYEKSGRGDVDFESVVPKASFVTPVPGGMGPMVIAAVLENLVRLSL
ncbi:MAG TPA: bifunctional 5,10-methylenetetrahydrofolate dehydrogenase/5,10-methenyltetrahydrofolate cyclohydrolase [Candidatus Paceibacterota bacterium]|nr:bifunctional 5,10-methylenetetrahydrofolate dehydrogenase/5,10-methenyltetrahydrofolate cyclohydrolase [Candidatus Paceibacterota bacterium]